MERIKNKKGSVLTTTVIISMLILTLTGIMYGIAWWYFAQSIENNEQRQAYLYAKSECDVIAKYFINYGNDQNDNPYSVDTTKAVKEPADKSADTFNITLTNNNSKAKNDRVRAIPKNTNDKKYNFGKVWYSKKTDNKNGVATIKVTVTYHKQSSTVSLTVNKQGDTWTKGYYS